MKLNKVDKSFFINLDRRVDRLDHINKNLPFNAEKFRAVDATKLQLNEEVEKLFHRSLDKLTKATIACFLSHYKLWKQLIEDDSSENYLILEDDVVFKDGFTQLWNQAYSGYLPEDYNLIYLGGCQPCNKPQYPKVLKKYNDFFCNVKKNDFFTKGDHFWHMNASSYILSKKAAKSLCLNAEQFGIDHAVDIFILRSLPYQYVYHLNPLMAYQLHEENDNMEIDKNSDLRFAKEKFKDNNKNILYWHWHKGFGNFGDELNVPVGKFLFGENTTFNKKNISGSIRLIGSMLGDVENEDLVCGVGAHHHTQKLKGALADYRCVRGPLSLSYLESRGVSTGDIFLGDPALLLKSFYKPIIDEKLKDKIGVVPHISNINYFHQQTLNNEKFYLIHPTNSWEQVVSEIYSCKSVISSSLHGLICADAYDKPNVWIKVPEQSIPPCDKNSDYGDFKYWDYFKSQGRQIKFINSIHDNLEDKLYKEGNNINLNKLKNSILGKNIDKAIPKKNIKKMILLSDDLFEEDFIDELFSEIDYEKIFDSKMQTVQDGSIIVYSNMIAENINIYPEKHRQFLRDRLNQLDQYFAKCKDCILIHLSDEHCHAKISHYKNFKHVFRQYYRSDAVADNVTFIPLGYKKGFHNE